MLALRRGWVGRDELAALSWPGATGERAGANVRKALHLARGLPWAAGLEVQPIAVPAAFASAIAVRAKSLFLAEWPNTRRGPQSAHIEPLLGKALYHGGLTRRVYMRRSSEDP